MLEPTGPQPVSGIVSPVVSPDGRSIAFVALGDLWLLPVGSGTPIQLTNDESADADPAWSPDGRELAFTTDRDGTMNVWVRDLQTGRDRQITFSRTGNCSGAAWSPDGTKIAYLVDRMNVEFVRVRAGGVSERGLPRPPTQQGELGRPSWSADSRSVAVGALFPFSNRYREGLNQLLIDRLDPGGWSSSLDFPRTFGRQPSDARTCVGSRRLSYGVCQRRPAVGRRREQRRRRHRSADADRGR